MAEMMAALKKAQKRAIKAIRRAQREQSGEVQDVENDDDDDDDDDDDASDANQDEKSDSKDGEDDSMPPMMIFFSPTTLEQLLEMVMNLSEYQTFSMMMRMKVQQKRVLKLLMQARDEEGLMNGLLAGESKEEGKDQDVTSDQQVKVEVDDDFMFNESEL